MSPVVVNILDLIDMGGSEVIEHDDSYNTRTAFLQHPDKILELRGQESYIIRTGFLNYTDKLPELYGQRWHLITNLSKM